MSGDVTTERRERTLSRIGRKAIPIPAGVQVTPEYGQITVNGPRGSLVQPLHPDVTVRVEDSQEVGRLVV
jgi:large subunit ribosomal protein L6